MFNLAVNPIHEFVKDGKFRKNLEGPKDQLGKLPKAEDLEI